ncbi:hypothetical protein MAPG_03295 [Magnaporthiopsis poae ATCC 64411]|uniref:Uncharacterized protein n=1 Tax=Magnaporthiopsis poae (strain ATCC 64411 / 73-15) TaxID=644358 RepID=A0A0C4DTM4_MAGP6|nr:hypothetical protein MAPG_03295 [Magnaporthiopsis poae ATCC 64411]
MTRGWSAAILCMHRDDSVTSVLCSATPTRDQRPASHWPAVRFDPERRQAQRPRSRRRKKWLPFFASHQSPMGRQRQPNQKARPFRLQSRGCPRRGAINDRRWSPLAAAGHFAHPQAGYVYLPFSFSIKLTPMENPTQPNRQRRWTFLGPGSADIETWRAPGDARSGHPSQEPRPVLSVLASIQVPTRVE